MHSAFAPAKINLFLHVGPLAPDGYHPLCSWMVFADIGDEVSLGEAEEMDFALDGPFAAQTPAGEGNLVLEARDAVIMACRGPEAPFRLVLTKNLPVASGLGGGSADAAATLRLVGEHLDFPEAESLAPALGSDVPACLLGRSLMAEGRGEKLGAAPAAPPLDAVLVNPGVTSSTREVYAAYDASGAPGEADNPDLPPVIGSAEEVAALLSLCRNDLETPACALQPAIAEVLETLRDEPETLIARMSGSGATCFALCASGIEADSLAERLALMRPEWWVRACRLT